ncbi:hypothetical protein D9M68_927810 [compost metagenome]
MVRSSSLLLASMPEPEMASKRSATWVRPVPVAPQSRFRLMERPAAMPPSWVPFRESMLTVPICTSMTCSPRPPVTPVPAPPLMAQEAAVISPVKLMVPSAATAELAARAAMEAARRVLMEVDKFIS